MPTRPLWEIPTIPPMRPETAEERRARLATAARARAAIRLRKDAEGRVMLARLRALETSQRLKDDAAWRASHAPPTKADLETLRGMFPNLNRKRTP
jgi:hypothetical protein